MIAECPHCHATVVLAPDGGCPACRRRAGDAPGGDPERTEIEVAEGEPLPPVCVSCGRPAAGSVRLKRRSPRRVRGASAFILVLSAAFLLILVIDSGWSRESAVGWIALLSVPIAIISAVAASIAAWVVRSRSGVRRGGRSSVPLVLPACGTCSRRRAPAPITVDLEEFRMTLPVHRAFAEGLKALRARGADRS